MTNKSRNAGVILGAALATVPTFAMAHTGIGATHGFAHGFLHPMSGADHILAMVMVGIFAAQLGGRAVLLVPLTFVSLMIVGGAVGVMGGQLPYVEVAIALSVLVLGGIVASDLAWPVLAASMVVGFFAIFHGYAHGVEMPDDAGGLAYGAGFVAATAMLHFAGVLVGFGLVNFGGARTTFLLRGTGVLTAAAGGGLLISAF